MVGPSVIVGRDRELELMLAALRRARTSGDLVLLTGEAGMGKTTLAADVVAVARDEGRCVLEGRATPTAAPISLGVFRDAVRNHLRRTPSCPVPEDELAAAFPGHLLPELGEPRRQELEQRDVLFEAAARYVADLARPDGLVLVLEDLHWADTTSHDLLLHLARVSRDCPVLIVATCRLDEFGGATALDDLRLDRRRERLGDEIALGPLDPDAAGLLVERFAPGAGAEIGSQIHRRADGNPFVIEELARDVAAGTPLGDGELPWSVRQMLIGRVERLDPDDRRLLDWAAVAGECFDLTLLQEASACDDDSFLTSLDRLRKAGLIVDDQCTLERMCFRHNLTRDAVMQELTAADRRLRYRRLLAAAERLGGSESGKSLDALVSYAVGAGDRRAAFEYSLAAARRSLALGGYREVDVHYERALELWTPEIGLADRATVLLELGRAPSNAHHPHRAMDALRQARTLFLELGDRAAAAVTLTAHAQVRHKLGERDAVLADLRAARAELGPDAPVVAQLQVRAGLARILMLQGRSGEAASVAREALGLVTERPSREEALEAVQLWVTLGAVLAEDGTSDRAALERGLELARAIGDPAGAVRAICNLEVLLRWHRAEGDEAARYRREGIAIAARHGLGSMETLLHEAEAEAQIEMGGFADAALALDRVERLTGVQDDGHMGIVGLRTQRAILRLAAGDLDDAEWALSELWPSRTRTIGHFEIELVAAAFIAIGRLARGDEAGAARMVEDDLLPLAEATRSDQVWPALVIGLGVAAALGRADLAERFPRPLMGWAGADGDRLIDALLMLARGVAAPAGVVEAGAGSIERAGFPWRGAATRLMAAWALARVAPGDEAAELAWAADRWFDRVGARGWSTVARGVLRRMGRRAPTRTSSEGGGLTARETEVLRLVADGATNREIAERLVISPPTAARHVANIFLKLRVGSRAEAVRVAAERDLLGHATST